MQVVPLMIEYSPLIPTWRCDVQVKIGMPLQVRNYVTTTPKGAASALTADLKAALNQ